MAWSGTVGELAAALHEPEIELLEALHANSEVLRNFGIAVTVCETVGRMRSVSLRGLEGRKQANAEGANTAPRLPASDLDSAQGSDASNLPAENVSSHDQPSHRAIAGERTASQLHFTTLVCQSKAAAARPKTGGCRNHGAVPTSGVFG